MSSVVQFSDGSIVAYVKGAPEVILELSEKGTVPINVKQQLKTLTEKGYRVIAMGHKTLPAGIEYKRDMVESNLTFSGLIVLENRIKTQTPNVLKTLNKSGFFSVMSTGTFDVLFLNSV
jgi:cation-transporting ATPase 13A2